MARQTLARSRRNNRVPVPAEIEMSYRLRLAGRGSIHEPKELADGSYPCCRCLIVAGAYRAENCSLLAACNEKRDAPTAVDHWVGHGDTHLGPAVRNGCHPSLTLLK